MKTLVFGKTGQVAIELQRHDNVIALDRSEADLSDPAHCAKIILETDADVVINAAAYTAVDKAEEEEAAASVINGDAPTEMAKAAAKRGLPFVHISTDYVFDGHEGPPKMPDEATAPINAYGRSKLKGELGVLAAGGKFAIMRTSWVFSAHGNNFVKTMLRLAETRDELSIVADQIGGPTPAKNIADASLAIARSLLEKNEALGVFHFSGSPSVSWADFAREIFAQSGRKVTVHDILTEAYPTPAQRPKNSQLNCDRITELIGIPQPDWRTELTEILREID